VAAVAIAWSIPAVGWVTVSLRRSITLMNLASVNRGNPFQGGITAVMATNNQPLARKRLREPTIKSIAIIR
jgi:hypothetical protein